MFNFITFLSYVLLKFNFLLPEKKKNKKEHEKLLFELSPKHRIKNQRKNNKGGENFRPS